MRRWPSCLRPFPHLVSSCLHSSFLNPHTTSQVSPHPASAPPSSRHRTHAKGQQKNVEQDLDTLHSSFHRHGCRAWGRGRAGVLELAEGALGFRAPCRPSKPSLRGPHSRPRPPGNPRSGPRLPAPAPGRREGWGRPRAQPDRARARARPPPPRPGADPRARGGAGARRPPSAASPGL